MRAQLDDADEKARLVESAGALGNRMVEAIKNQETFPNSENEHNQAFEIMKFLVMTLKEEWPFAWNYWKTHWNMEE